MMSAQKALAVSGEKKAGKTTLLEKLIPALARRGVRTAVIKHDGHGFYPDREGTDTNRVFTAGAVGAAVFDGEKFQVVKRVPVAEQELISLFPEADLVLLEGFKASSWPKIEVLGKTGRSVVNEPGTLIAVVTEGESPHPHVLKFHPEEAEELAEFLCAWRKNG